MNTRSLLLCLVLALLAACQPTPPVRQTIQPFPTMTLGQNVRGVLTPGAAQSIANLSNPATVEALANRSTPTPNYTACPAAASGVRLGAKPATTAAATSAILTYLNAGGSLNALEAALRADWQAWGASGYLRQHDLTGSGAQDVVLGYTAPEGSGMLLVIGCADGSYVLRYDTTSDGSIPPEVVWAGDINRNFVNDLIFARRICAVEDACEFETQLIEFQRARGCFVNLLDETLLSLNIPSVSDIDGDEVYELVLSLQSRGNSATGPLRTGVNIYDWNGLAYTLSIIQLDPPRYRIQIIHEADRNFIRLDMANAITLYQQALDNADLRAWFNDEEAPLRSYLLYRLLLAYAYLGDPRLADALVTLNTEFVASDAAPLAALPPYVEMAYVFLNNIETSRNLNAACAAVQAVISERPEALRLLNRYGSRSPTYTVLDLCPF